MVETDADKTDEMDRYLIIYNGTPACSLTNLPQDSKAMPQIGCDDSLKLISVFNGTVAEDVV